ncbi:MAG: glycogen synthase GlgA [Lachnospiraceae bacterium]|nr:glycogen synthase GlgA [Lachnospiraceae bacterium]
MKKILYVASECVPFIKTGGLADVVGTLPKTFSKDEADVRVVIPNYMCMKPEWKEQMKDVTYFSMDLSWRNQYVGIKELVYEGITFYFIDNEYYFAGPTPYSTMEGDIEKFCYFSKAALSILPVLDFKPDIIHCHDWQAGLLPVYLKTTFAGNSFYEDIKTVFTIHNLQFQGMTGIDRLKDLSGLPAEVFTADKLECYGGGNMLKGGLTYADEITTVSDTYAGEIQMPYYGEKLDGLLRARNNHLTGIVNGIDYKIYDPSADPALTATYSVEDVFEKKSMNKMALQKKTGLPEKKDMFVIGIISRLTDQKGLDLIDYIMDDLCRDDIQFVVLGSGDPKYENMFRYYEHKYPTIVSANICYDDTLSKMMYAGCDAILMPSRFEPCGLCQLMALRYGTVPIVRETGGLKDTVEPFNEYENDGTGFSFTNYNAHDMLHVIEYAKEVYYDQKAQWNGIVERGMKKDFSWKRSAGIYMDLYEKMLTIVEEEPETEDITDEVEE